MGFTPQESIAESLSHTGLACDVEWIPTLACAAGADFTGYDGMWCAPGSPFLSLEGALRAIRVAREAGMPFIGTCAGFQHGVIEFARTVLGMDTAGHAEYGSTDDLIIDELYCSLVGQTLRLHLVDPQVIEWYGGSAADERYYCRFGLDESYRPALEAAGLRVGGVDAADGSTRILRIPELPFYVLTLFVPQTRSEPGAPHPLIHAFARACAGFADVG